MKTALFLLLASGFFAARAQNSSFTITGDVSKVKQPVSMVYFSYSLSGERKKDSFAVKNGRYQFRGELEYPVMGFFEAVYSDTSLKPDYRRDYFVVYLDRGPVQISSVDSFSNRRVSGSAAHEVFLALEAEDRKFFALGEELFKQRKEFEQEGKTEEVERLKQQAMELEKRRKEEVYGDFIRKNPSSPLALYALNNYAGYRIDPEKVAPLFNSISLQLRESYAGKEFAARLEGARRMQIGVMATDFTQNDTLGHPVSLSSFRGKYVLVDFWASWCRPCRLENPNIVSEFHKYRDRGFTVLGVALESAGAREAWMKAIHKDGLTWTHVSDFKSFENEVAKLYGVNAIPRNLLVGPDGKILAVDLRGEDLGKKLAEIFE